MTELVALLPMKLNSERVPGKNFKPFVGKPLFEWTLEALLSVPEIQKVIINTDARSVLEEHELIRHSRVEVRDRKSELCGDFVSMNKIIMDDVLSTPATAYLMTHTTNPLITKDTFSKAIKEFETRRKSGSIDSLFSVNSVQSRFYTEDGAAINHDPDNLIRTQDLQIWLEENSCLYIFSRESFESTGARIGAKPGMYVTPRCESIDIDDREDWEMAEALAAYRIQRNKDV